MPPPPPPPLVQPTSSPARGARGPHGGFTKPFRVHCRNLLVQKALRSRAMPSWSPGNRMAPTVCVGSSMRNDICRPGPRFHSSTDAGCADGPGPLPCTALHCTALAPIPRDRRRLCPLVLPCPCSNPSLTCCYCCYSAAASAASTPLRLRAGSETRFHPANSPRRHACLPVPAHPPIPQPAVGALSLAPSQPRCLPATRLLGMTLMLNVIPSPVNPRLTTVL
ncbi:hypothetical protein COCSADRAFT_274736 [Bipolaris sorokiniana ND90Pr]|uniref:Uncharacterized protein n=1 Tax=Cochliobolus sativus (strain ND90Pr / ATCC 201652) TaxID=665912 RepID=M2T2D4_COCSN|nr:uncharacterized protein COCSADRAFT_274736 [Bipolaris sorokiniana ND90Pr]EMD68630.1 hypothetical protein COCSADRAFT_274736 [Bipolaris sorokiniana ND90Pr]